MNAIWFTFWVEKWLAVCWLFVGCVKCQDSHCWCAFIWLTANWEMMPVRCPYSMQLAKRTSSPFHCIKIYQRSRGASLSLSEYLMRKRALHGVRWHYNYKQLNTFLSNKKYVRKKWEFRIGRNIRKRIQVSSGHDQSIILPHQSTMCLCKNASPFARNEMMRTKKKQREARWTEYTQNNKEGCWLHNSSTIPGARPSWPVTRPATRRI